MAEEIGKIEKPSVEELKGGRKLYFVPLIYSGKESPSEYLEKFDKYWLQVEAHVTDLELKLGKVSKIYHELIPASDEEGAKAVKGLNDRSYQIVKNRLEKGAQLETTEESELLTEFMDWGRCLALGLQNQKVFNQVYQSYIEAGKQRNEHIAKHINETLKADEIGVLFMGEGHQVQFPADIEVFYVSPPALDEIKRWLREREAQLFKENTNSVTKEKGDSR